MKKLTVVTTRSLRRKVAATVKRSQRDKGVLAMTVEPIIRLTGYGEVRRELLTFYLKTS